MMNCPLCNSPDTYHVGTASDSQDWLHCLACGFLFVLVTTTTQVEEVK